MGVRSLGRLGWQVWVAAAAVLVLVAAGAGFAAYELGSRASRTATLAGSASPLPTTSVSPLPTTASSPTPRPTSPAQSPSPSPQAYPTLGGAPIIATTLQCKLPVYLPGTQGSGAFIDFPAGTVTPDPSSAVTAPGSEVNVGGPGDWFGLTYDRTAKRWLAVPYPWVSPDGVLYAYTMDFNRHAGFNPLIEVNAQTGTTATLQPAAPINGAWQVVDFSSTYIFAINPQHAGLYSIPISGLWNNENYVQSGFWTAASGSYAFGSDTPDGGAIVRIDVRNQTRVSWFNKASSVQIIGFDGGGNPVMWTGTDLEVATAPNQATTIATTAPLAVGAAQQGLYGVQSPVADSHGLWLSLTDGIYLWADGKLTKVSNVVGQVAGTCA